MVSVNQNTLHDIEFNDVLRQISNFCETDLGNKAILKIRPLANKTNLLKELHYTNEYLSSFENENTIPNHYFDDINTEIKCLKIENYVLEANSFKKIRSISITSNELIKFINKFQTYYPKLNGLCSLVDTNDQIKLLIDEILDKYGEVRDNASPELLTIRKLINALRSQINQSFSSALTYYNNLNFLDDIRESVIDNKRVLAVKAMNRRKVRGTVLGHSKTGSIVFIEPETTHKITRELENSEVKEKEEILKILKKLTSKIAVYTSDLVSYQDLLIKIDTIFAKSKYAATINGIKPLINNNKNYFLKDAFHPLLLTKNQDEGKKTFPQTIHLNESNRIIVISGPNAGGKSITLKTIGLLQIMLQSGILIPVHEKSDICLFDNILTDIGDNQSIENHLSTYSYRLKQMNYFLKKCKANTLFLIDEFGTGSDPELGGALAETFLEEFYERNAYGIITTHYTNLKLLANELPHITNANMRFDEKKLIPEYKLVLGEAGSSFTFEVAQKNGIPFSLINKAKKKVERGKVRFDKTITKLQKERTKLEKTQQSLRKNEIKKIAETDKFEAINLKIQKKLESYQELYDYNQRLIHLGKKIDQISNTFFQDKKKKSLITDFLKIVAIENSKRKKISKKEQKIEEQKSKAINKEVTKVVEKIRKTKKQTVLSKIEKSKPKVKLKIGDRVRLIDSKSVGTIDQIEKNKAIVNYGIFTTNVSLDKLELI
ncbi:MAG: endonuclease MutS2 [Flavobacteriaceae bacterium]